MPCSYYAIVWSKYSSFDITWWNCCFTGRHCTGLITMSSFTCTIAYCFQLTAPTRGLNIAAPPFATIHAMNNALKKEWMSCYSLWYCVSHFEYKPKKDESILQTMYRSSWGFCEFCGSGIPRSSFFWRISRSILALVTGKGAIMHSIT